MDDNPKAVYAAGRAGQDGLPLFSPAGHRSRGVCAITKEEEHVCIVCIVGAYPSELEKTNLESAMRRLQQYSDSITAGGKRGADWS